MKNLFALLVILLASGSFAAADDGGAYEVGVSTTVEHDAHHEHHDGTVVWKVLGAMLGGTLLLELLCRVLIGKPFMGSLVRADGSFPLIVPVLGMGLLCFTGFSNDWFPSDFSWMKNHDVNHASLLGLWFFFAVLGAEISIPKIRSAGSFVGLATVGGVAWPIAFTFGTISLVNWWFSLGVPYTAISFVALGAGATDVPMSLGAMKIASRVLPTATAGLALDALRILAVGDDVAGVGIMAAVHGTNINMDFVVLESMIIALAYFFGTHGYYEVREGKEPGEIERTYYRDVTVRQPLIWWGLALINTYVLYRAGLEPMLGGCLVFICSPTAVKHAVEKWLVQPSLLFLLFFAFVAGGIDLADSAAFGPVTAAVVVGGFLGKFKGIFFGAKRGEQGLAESSEYLNFPTRGTSAFSICASANGTVAIIFVATALFKDRIEPWFAAQATLGFLGTVAITYLFAIGFAVYGRRWNITES